MAKGGRKIKPTPAVPATIYDADGRILSAPVPAEWLEQIREMDRARARIDRAQTRQIKTPATPPTQPNTPQIDRARRALLKMFPNGTDASTATVTRMIANELKTDIRQRGVKAPSWDSVNRALGRRKK